MGDAGSLGRHFCLAGALWKGARWREKRSLGDQGRQPLAKAACESLRATSEAASRQVAGALPANVEKTTGEKLKKKPGEAPRKKRFAL